MKKAVEHLKSRCPRMRVVIEAVGPCRMKFLEPQFSTLARSIVFQQLSGKAASTIYGRLEAAAGEVTPERILALRPAKMRSLGLSRAKAEYVRDLARKTRDGEVDFAALAKMTDDDAVAHLTAVKGVGVWTVHMFQIFALRRPDILPTGDLGVRSAMKKVYELEELPKPDEMIRLAAPLRPYASVASWYFWRSLDGPAAM
ncbi:MAG: DNA-3-methyladenine glycosylase [Bryobacteraceae bacterium]